MDERTTSRRRFLERSAVALAGGGFLAGAAHRPCRLLAAERTSATAANLIAGKDAQLIVYGAAPLEIETPLRLLAEHAMTPKSLLFVRNNQQLAGFDDLQPAAARDWNIEIVGLVDRPASVSVVELLQMEQVEHELVLQCSGNGRAFFSKLSPAKGAQWQCGAMGNVRFAGVPLAKVFEQLKLEIDPAARFLTAAGRDAPSKPEEPDFEHSIPLDDALARSIIALSMNGEPIPAVHGGPARLVTPGYYATMNVKWLGQMRLESQETTNYHQVGRYRTPKESIPLGSAFTSNLANSDANWRMRTKSVIFAPLAGQLVSAGRVEVRGVAWNDGAAKIETVLISAGPDRPWQRATIEAAASPYAWQPWSIALELLRGEHSIAAQAIDAQGRSQSFSAAAQWNPAGYAYSGVHVVNVVAS